MESAGYCELPAGSADKRFDTDRHKLDQISVTFDHDL